MVDKVYQTYDTGVAGAVYNNFAEAILAVRDFAYPSIDYDVNWTITKTAGQWTQVWIDGSGKPDQDVTAKVQYLLETAIAASGAA
jgi:hypothetical protein